MVVGASHVNKRSALWRVGAPAYHLGFAQRVQHACEMCVCYGGGRGRERERERKREREREREGDGWTLTQTGLFVGRVRCHQTGKIAVCNCSGSNVSGGSRGMSCMFAGPPSYHDLVQEIFHVLASCRFLMRWPSASQQCCEEAFVRK